jgi:ribosome-associated protein
LKAKVKSKKSLKEESLKDLIVLGMKEKKAEDIVVIDLRSHENAIADFFVLCSGNSDTHVGAIADSIDEVVYKQSKENPGHKEGFATGEWILLDYIDVVAHIFRSDKRKHFGLEDLWGDLRLEHIS